jgi:hypothetical protein
MSNAGDGKKKSSTWNLPDPPPAWTLDLANQPELPPEGEYQARIALKLSDASQSTLWLFVNYSIDGIAAAPATEMGVLAVRDGSKYADRVNEGRRLLYRLLTATGVQLPTDPFDLPALLEGKPVALTIGHRVRDGVKELVVRKVSPPRR